MNFSNDLTLGVFEGEVITNILNHECLDRVMYLWKSITFPALKLWEFYIIHIDTTKSEFTKLWNEAAATSASKTTTITTTTFNPSSIDTNLFDKYHIPSLSTLREKADLLVSMALKLSPGGHRYQKRLSTPILVAFIFKWIFDLGGYSKDNEDQCRRLFSQQVDHALHLLSSLLDEINLMYYQEYDQDVAVIHDQVKARAMFLRVSDHGPKLGNLSRE